MIRTLVSLFTPSVTSSGDPCRVNDQVNISVSSSAIISSLTLKVMHCKNWSGANVTTLSTLLPVSAWKAVCVCVSV